MRFFRDINRGPRTILRKQSLKLFLCYSAKKIGHSLLLLVLLLGSMNGGNILELFSPKVAEAAYTGKQMRTVEYLLGGGTDNTIHGDLVVSYAGSSWSRTKSSAGLKNIVIEGSGIVVKHAYLDLQFRATSTVNTNDIILTMDVEGASSSSTDALTDNEFSVSLHNSSALTAFIRGQHDVTTFFDRQNDVAWNAGIQVVAGVSADFSAASNRILTSLKLVVTYEQDYSASAHSETKTVRFPLDSTTVGDTGSRQSACAGSATCSFDYYAYIPDATADADILDVHFELHAEVDSASASTLTPQINGGAAGTAFAWLDTLTDDQTINIFYQPAIGGANFTRNATQTLDVVNGTVALNMLGGELVVTYRYSTGASLQTETIRYFLHQRTTAPGTTRNNFATTSVSIDNSGGQVRNIWYKVHTAPIGAATMTVFGKVATGTERSQGYVISGVNSRTGDTPTVILDLSQDAGNATTTSSLAGAIQFSATNGGAPAVEALITFTWDGTSGGNEVQTVLFSAPQQGVTNIANYFNNQTAYIYLSERVTKSYRSAYVEAILNHSDTTSIAASTITLGVNANTITVPEADDGTDESFTATYLYEIGTSTLASTTNAGVIPWTSRAIVINQSINQADERYFGNIIVLTYSANFSENGPVPVLKHARTVEYLLGGGSDNTTRGDNVNAYAGASWNTVKGTAGTQSIVLEGTDIKVLHAFVEVGFLSETSANVQNVSVTLDVARSSSAGTDTRVSGETSVSPYNTSGLTGYVESVHDVTALFDRQSDGDWSSGVVTVTGGVQVDYAAGGQRRLTTMKLVITYEQEYSTTAHYEVKTVRFPLDSTAALDDGSRQAACSTSATCAFQYYADMPEDANNNNIMDVFFEIHAEVDSGTASTFTPEINGGSAGTAFNWTETFTDDNTVRVLWSPAIGGSNFNRNATQTLDVVNGSVPLNVLGGELVVTYRYLTDAVRQTETIRWMLYQETTIPTTARIDVPTTTIQIANGGMIMKNVWFKLLVAPTSTLTITAGGKIGTSSERTQAYAYAGTNPRAGNPPTIFLDLSSDIGNFYATTTDVAGFVQFSAAGGAAPGVEAYLTFTWNGKEGGPQTKSLLFGSQQGTSPTANQWATRGLYVSLPEAVQKTYGSVYVETGYHHSETTSLTIGRVSTGVNAARSSGTTTVRESPDLTSEAYLLRYFHFVASTTFATSSLIGWTTRVLNINNHSTVADENYFSNILKVTYAADLPYLQPRYTQNYFRFFGDDGTLVPYDPWPVGSSTDLAENAEITASDTPIMKNEAIRIRTSITIASTTVASSSQAFTLQFSPRISTCGVIATSSWIDVGEVGSSALWRGTSTAITDGSLLSTNPATAGDLLLSVSDRAGTFEKNGTTTYNPWPYLEGEDIEYDWLVSPLTTVATNTSYCFRMIKSNGEAFNVYTYYPVIRTAGFVAKSQNWRWYDDATGETPTLPLANENTAPVNIEFNNSIKLRITLREVNNEHGVNQKFRVQFSESSTFASGVYFLSSTSTCVDGGSLWCYADGGDVDDDIISTRVLTDSTASGRHNETPTSTSTFDPIANTATEYEYTIRHAGASVNTVYFFRLYDTVNDRPVNIESGETYPSLSTDGTTLSVTISGVGNASTTEGVTTTGTSTATAIPFGSVLLQSTSTLAQRFTISTNASRGYTVYVSAQQDFLNEFGDRIPGVSASNTSPLPWGTSCPSSLKGCFGYHSGDNELEGSTRFLTNDTWAGLETVSRDIIFSSGPTIEEETDIIYQMFIRSAQESGNYSTAIIYTVIPTF